MDRLERDQDRQERLTVRGTHPADNTPCSVVQKCRGLDAGGDLWFDDWCFKHHHWMRDASAGNTAGGKDAS